MTALANAITLDEAFMAGKPEGGNTFPLVDISPKHEKVWTETAALFMMSAPAFSYILINMLAPKGQRHTAYFTNALPTAAVDGAHLYANPTFFFEKLKTNDERVFVLGHEVLHSIFNHPGLMATLRKRGSVTDKSGKSAPFDPAMLNRAMDYIINDLLVKSGIGTMPAMALHDPSIGQSTDAVADVYVRLYEAQQQQQQQQQQSQGQGQGQGGTQQSNQQGQGQGQGQQGFDEVLEPPQGHERSEQAWKSAVAAGMQLQKMQGSTPADLMRMLGALVQPQVDWREHIQALLARKLGFGSVDWRKAERRAMERGLFMPRRSGNGAGTVVVACDTSGSVSDHETNVFLAEVAGILDELNPERVVLMWCDAKVGRVDEVEDASDLTVIRGKGAPGGGGTAFAPVFDEVQKLGLSPDALVYLTDGYAWDINGLKVPTYPVVWGSTHAGPGHYPFGEVVKLTIKQELA